MQKTKRKGTDELLTLAPSKITRPVDLDLPDEIVTPEEKAVDPEAVPSEDEVVEEPPEEVTLDDEELNPFGDKWEQ